MKKRVKKIFDLSEEKPDLILIINPGGSFVEHNFFYATGLDKGLFEGCSAVLFPDGKIDLIVSELESQTAENADANVEVFKNLKEYSDILKETVGSAKSIGLNYNGISFSDFLRIQKLLPNLSYSNVSKAFVKARSVKDYAEINLIKNAAKIVDSVVEKIPEMVHDELYEYELAAEIDYLMQKNGADKAGFETISSFGKNSSEPHYTHGDTIIKPGDFVLCDFGACFKNYNSDITRTFVFGNASEKQKKMHETVSDAQNLAFEKIKAGVKGKKIHNAVENYINKSEFKGCFIHSTGHSLGLAVHDGGVGFGPESETELIEHMVLTVEPGVYIPGFGGVRIEDDIVVKKDGIELLTNSPRNLIEI